MRKGRWQDQHKKRKRATNNKMNTRRGSGQPTTKIT